MVTQTKGLQGQEFRRQRQIHDGIWSERTSRQDLHLHESNHLNFLFTKIIGTWIMNTSEFTTAGAIIPIPISVLPPLLLLGIENDYWYYHSWHENDDNIFLVLEN